MNKKVNNKKMYLWICLIIMILIIVIVVLFAISNNTPKANKNPDAVSIIPGVPDDPNRITVTNKNMKKEQCVNDICIKDVVVTCYPDRGSIKYKITNKGKSEVSGYLKMVFDNYTGYIVYNNLGGGKTEDGYIGYSGYDLRKIKEYQLRKLSNSEYSVIVK